MAVKTIKGPANMGMTKPYPKLIVDGLGGVYLATSTISATYLGGTSSGQIGDTLTGASYGLDKYKDYEG